MKAVPENVSLKALTCFLCLVVYGPMFVFGLLLVTLKRFVCYLNICTGKNYVKMPKIGKLCRRSPISDITRVSTMEEMKFLKYRSPVYLYRTTIWTAAELSRFLLGHQKVPLISEHHLMYVALNSVFAHSLKWKDEEKLFVITMSGFDKYTLFKGFYWELRAIKFNEDCSSLQLVFSNNKTLSWPCRDTEIDDWNLAKLHAQVCMTYYAPGLSHNYVHFVLPSTVTVLTKSLLSPMSILYRLLEPHTQFTERINYQALNVNRSTSNKRSFMDKYFRFWKAIPISMEQFVEGVAGECHKHYYSRSENERQNSNFPPRYVQDENLQKIPYLKFLTTYYAVIKKFVSSISHLIDPDEWKYFSSALSVHVPKVADSEMVDVISTFIHQVAGDETQMDVPKTLYPFYITNKTASATSKVANCVSSKKF